MVYVSLVCARDPLVPLPPPRLDSTLNDNIIPDTWIRTRRLRSSTSFPSWKHETTCSLLVRVLLSYHRSSFSPFRLITTRHLARRARNLSPEEPSHLSIAPPPSPDQIQLRQQSVSLHIALHHLHFHLVTLQLHLCPKHRPGPIPSMLPALNISTRMLNIHHLVIQKVARCVCDGRLVWRRRGRVEGTIWRVCEWAGMLMQRSDGRLVRMCLCWQL